MSMNVVGCAILFGIVGVAFTSFISNQNVVLVVLLVPTVVFLILVLVAPVSVLLIKAIPSVQTCMGAGAEVMILSATPTLDVTLEALSFAADSVSTMPITWPFPWMICRLMAWPGDIVWTWLAKFMLFVVVETSMVPNMLLIGKLCLEQLVCDLRDISVKLTPLLHFVFASGMSFLYSPPKGVGSW
jgi:hypothetical protein